MWSCSFYYVMLLSKKHAEEKKKCIEEVTSEFFGKFTAISHISILVGTIFMSVVFESVGIKKISEEVVDIETAYATSSDVIMFGNGTEMAATTSYFAQSTDPQTIEKCGLFYKFADAKVDKDKGVDHLIMYILLSAYLAFNLVAATLCLCLDEVTNNETETVQEVCESMLSLNSHKLEICSNNIEKSPGKEDLNNHNVPKKVQEKQSAFQLLKSTLRLLATDKAAWLLIPFTLHYGMIQGFARGVYNASWVTCALGK